MQTLLRKFFGWMGRLVLTGVVLMGVLLIGLNIPLVQEKALKWGLEKAFPSHRVELQGVQGRIPFTFSLDHLSLQNDQGEWLALEGFSFSWNPFSLFSGSIWIHYVRCEHFSLERIPEEFLKNNKENATSFSLPSIPHLYVELVQLRDINLGSSVTGLPERIELEAVGKAQVQPFKAHSHEPKVAPGELGLVNLLSSGQQVDIDFKLFRKQATQEGVFLQALLSPAQVNVHFKAHDSRILAHFLKVKEASKAFTFTLQAQGDPQNFFLTAHLDGPELYQGHFKGAIEKDKKQWRLGPATLTHPLTKFELSGQWVEEGKKGEFLLECKEIEPILTRFKIPLAGSFQGALLFSQGRDAIPDFSLNWKVESAKLNKKKLEKLEGKMMLRNVSSLPSLKLEGVIKDTRRTLDVQAAVHQEDKETWFLERLAITGPGTDVEGSGRIKTTLQKEVPFKGKCHFIIQDLKAYQDWFHLTISGSLNIALHSEAFLQAELDVRRLQTPWIRMDELKGKMTYQDLKDFSLMVTLKGIQYQDFILQKGHIEATMRRGVGHFDVLFLQKATHPFLKALGEWRYDLGEGKLKVLQVFHRGHKVILKEPAFLKVDQEVHLKNLYLSLDQGYLRVKDFVWGSDLQGEVTVKNVPLSFAEIALEEMPVKGVIQADLTLKNFFQNPQGRMALDIQKIQMEEWAGESFALQAKLILRDGQLSSDTRLRAQSGLIQARHLLTLKSFSFQNVTHSPLQSRLTAQGRLRALNSLLSNGDRVDGQMDLSFKTTGSFHSPHFKGKLNLTQGYYENAFLGITLQGVALTLKGQDKHLMLRNFTARDGRAGQLTGEGAIILSSLHEWPKVDLRFRLNNFIIAAADWIRAKGFGNLSIQGRGLQSRIQGNLILDPLEVFLEAYRFDSVSTLKIIEKETLSTRAIEKKKKKKKKVLHILPLNLKIHIPNRLFVRGYGLASQWGGDMEIVGYADDPLVLGELQLQKGSFQALGQTMQLSKGKFLFDRWKPNNPFILLEANRTLQELTVGLKIEGRSDNPDIQFTSTPLLPKEEIISRILFNESFARLSPGQAYQLAQIITNLRSKRKIDYLDKLRQLTGFDEIEVREQQGEGQTTTHSVRVGKQLSENVHVSLEGGEETQRVIIDFGLTEHIHGSADVGIQGVSGGVNYVKNY